MVRNISKTTQAAALSAAALLALTACSGDSGEDTASGDVITVGIAGEVPYSYLDENGDPAGATVALAERIFGEMGYEVQAELVDWDNLIPGLNAERFDAISAGMSITPSAVKRPPLLSPKSCIPPHWSSRPATLMAWRTSMMF